MSDRLGHDPFLRTLKACSGASAGVALVGFASGVAFAGMAFLVLAFALVLIGVAPLGIEGNL